MWLMRRPKVAEGRVALRCGRVGRPFSRIEKTGGEVSTSHLIEKGAILRLSFAFHAPPRVDLSLSKFWWEPFILCSYWPGLNLAYISIDLLRSPEQDCLSVWFLCHDIWLFLALIGIGADEIPHKGIKAFLSGLRKPTKGLVGQWTLTFLQSSHIFS
jgi:hypothetical protein